MTRVFQQLRIPLGGWRQDRAPLDLTVVHRGKDLVDTVQRVFFDKGAQLHLAIEYQIQCSWVVLGRAAPVAQSARVEGCLLYTSPSPRD